MINISPRPLRIWKETNSWGAAHWRILLMKRGRLLTLSQNPDQAFTRNIPAFSEIASGAHFEYKLDVNDGNWLGANGEQVDFDPGDTIVAIYDVPKQDGWAGAPVTIEASRMNVWYGIATVLTVVP
jgi:hypothetical protein